MQAGLQKTAFDSIKEGRKKLECRVEKGHWKGVQPGSAVVFSCGDESISVRVSRVRFHQGENMADAIRTMLHSEGFSQCIPYAESFEDAFRIYHGIYGHLEGEQRMVVMEIQKVM